MQSKTLSIFHDSYTINQAATLANVSMATIHNWIKTNLLESSNGRITKESFEYFMANVAGKEKLVSRANKSQKDITEHINLDGILCLDAHNIGIEYEKTLSDSFRNKEGIYYTPSWVIEDMLKDVVITKNTSFLDPCCGCGNFIIEAIRQGVSPQNVYGYDTDENAVIITKQRIKEEFGFETDNIKVANFLEEASKLISTNVRFDLIYTNPPWGKKIEKKEKERYASLYDCGNSLDTTSLFLSACLSILNSKGNLGFLVQEAFFNIATFEDIRKKALCKRILRMVDYDKAFKALMTRAQAIIIENVSPKEDNIVSCSYAKKTFPRSQASFYANPKSILNFWTNEDEAKVMEQLFSIQHITLKNRGKWALGIVTGNNTKYCKATKEDDSYIPIYKGSDITKTGLKNPTYFISSDFSHYQQVAPIDMYTAPQKLIYRFISSDLCFYYDDKKRFVLNSANILIPYSLGISCQQLCSLLNSDILNWLFNKLFRTAKVLRGDIELLPIHIDYFKEYSEFSEENYLNYLKLKKENDGTYRLIEKDY